MSCDVVRRPALRAVSAMSTRARRSFAFPVPFLIICAAIITVAPRAHAYSLEHCKWHSATIKFLPYGPASPGGPYYTPAVNAANAWTGTPTPIYYEQVSGGSYNVLVNASNYGATGFDGITYWVCSNGYFSGIVGSAWNTYYANGYSSTGKKQVMVHELGHALGLAHNNSDCYVIMYPSSDRYFVCHISTPQEDDINGANAIYG